MSRKHQDIALSRTPVSEIWGIGRKSAQKLNLLGVYSAKELRDYRNERNIQKILTKTGLQIKHELMGINCFDFVIITIIKSTLSSLLT